MTTKPHRSPTLLRTGKEIGLQQQKKNRQPASHRLSPVAASPPRTLSSAGHPISIGRPAAAALQRRSDPTAEIPRDPIPPSHITAAASRINSEFNHKKKREKKRERRNHTALAAAKDFLVSLHEFLLPSPNPQREEREFSRRFLVAPLGRCRDRSSQGS